MAMHSPDDSRYYYYYDYYYRYLQFHRGDRGFLFQSVEMQKEILCGPKTSRQCWADVVCFLFAAAFLLRH